MSARTLDLDALRALALAADLGGYAQAASRLNRTPSAISLQMKRLQSSVGASLFRKDGRGVALTEAGEIVLRFGRRMLALNDELLDTVRGASLTGTVRLGFSQDFADTVLPAVLSQFSKLYPLVMIEVRIEGNATLVDAAASGEIDLALTLGHAEAPTATLLGEVELVWIASPHFVLKENQPIPLVMFGPQCAFRKEAIRRLDEAALPWRIAAISPSVAGLWASALGGLGVTARSRLGVPPSLTTGSSILDLPKMSSFPITLHACADARSACIERLREIIGSAVTEVLPSTGGERAYAIG